MDWVVAGLALIVIAVTGWWLFRYARSVKQGTYRHPEGAKKVWWVAGAGTHGGAGGQVPPLVPDSDPEDEIR